MKKLTITVIIIFNILTLSAQEKMQLVLCSTYNVKPSKLMEFNEVSSEMVKICNESSFPFSFYTWQNTNMGYEIWYPLSSLNEINNIEVAWNEVVTDEKTWHKFQDCIASVEMKTFYIDTKTSLLSDDNSLIPEEKEYCFWQELVYQMGKFKEVALVSADFHKIFKEVDIENNIHFSIIGQMGFTIPNVIAVEFSTNRTDYEKTSKEIYENFTDEQKAKIEELNYEMLGYTIDYKSRELYKVNRWCYVKKQ